MRATCPECGTQGPIAAFLIEDEAKRLALITAALPPALGRAVIAYLGLFKPPRSSLRLARVAQIAAEVADLAAAGTVGGDDESDAPRATQPSHWADGIEQLLAKRTSLSLPLQTHDQLRAVVYRLAAKGVSPTARPPVITQQLGQSARSGRHLVGTATLDRAAEETPLERQLNWISHMQSCGHMEEAEADQLRAEAHKKYGEK